VNFFKFTSVISKNIIMTNIFLVRGNVNSLLIKIELGPNAMTFHNVVKLTVVDTLWILKDT